MARIRPSVPQAHAALHGADAACPARVGRGTTLGSLSRRQQERFLYRSPLAPAATTRPITHATRRHPRSHVPHQPGPHASCTLGPASRPRQPRPTVPSQGREERRARAVHGHAVLVRAEGPLGRRVLEGLLGTCRCASPTAPRPPPRAQATLAQARRQSARPSMRDPSAIPQSPSTRDRPHPPTAPPPIPLHGHARAPCAHAAALPSTRRRTPACWTHACRKATAQQNPPGQVIRMQRA
jgi:hypothetical protein